MELKDMRYTMGGWISGLLGLELFMIGLFILGGFTTLKGSIVLLVASALIVKALCECSPFYALLNRIAGKPRGSQGRLPVASRKGLRSNL